MKDWSSWIVERRWPIIITTILLAVGSVLCLPQLKVDADFFHYLPEDHPVVRNFQKLTRGFSNDTVMLVVESDHLFSRDGMQAVWEINEEIAKMKGISSVTSLANVASINASENGIEIGALLNKEALGQDQEFYDRLKDRVVNDVHYKDILVSADGRFTSIVINLSKEAQPDLAALQLRKIAADHKGGCTVHFAGTPMMMSSIEQILWGDMQLLIPLVVLLLVLVLYFSFKRFIGIWLPLAAVGLGTLMVMAIMAFCGVSMTMISAILPIILLSNGSAYGIHVLSAIRQRQADNPTADNNETVLNSVKKVALPVSLAALTTLVGFLSFLSSPLSIFKEFGVEAAIGIVFSLVLALVFIPAVCSLFPPKKQTVSTAVQETKSKKLHWLDFLMGGWAKFVGAHYRAIVIAAAVIAVVSIPGIFRLHAGLDMMGFFSEDSDIRQADKVMNDHFGGSQPVFVAITAETVKNPLVLQKIQEITREMRANSNLHQINSISPIVSELNYHMDGLDMIPESQAAVGNLWLMVDGNASLAQMVAEDAKSAMIVGRIPQLSTEITKKLVDDIDSYYQRDNSFTALPVHGHPAEKQSILQAQMAKEIAHQLFLVAAYYQQDKSFDEAKARLIITKALGEDTPPLSTAEKEKLAADYFNSDDCDILVEDEDIRQQLVALAVKGANGAEIEQLWGDALSDLAADDPDGFSMAAGSLEDIFARGGLVRQSADLLAGLQAAGLLRDMPKLMEREVQGELFRIHNKTWPVTADFYEAITGNKAVKDQVVSFQVEQTGMHLVTVAISDKLTESQISSLLLSLLMVFLALLLQLHSLKNSSLALLPVLFTIIFMFGMEGYCHINIDILTALIASLAIGIGIDYSIHISFAMHRAAKAGSSFDEQLFQAISGSGQAILINAGAVVAGFLVIVASQMPVLRLFGGLVALAIAISAFGALTILPAIYMWVNKK